MVTALTLDAALPIGQAIRGGEPSPPVFIKTEEGNFRLIFGVHGIGPIGNSITSQMIEGVDGISFEYADSYLGTENLNKAISRLENQAFQKNIMSYLKDNRVPIYFGDTPISLIGTSAFLPLPLEAVLGTLTLDKKFDAKEIKARRQFIIDALKTITSLWGLTLLGRDLTIKLFQNELEKPWAKELKKLTFWAKKNLYLMPLLKKEQKKDLTLAIVAGGDHRMLAEYLKRGSEFCMEVINLYPRSIINLLFEDPNSYFPIIQEARFNPDHNFDLRYFNDPLLQRKFTS